MLKKYISKILLFILVGTTLSSCYCLRTRYTASPFDLDTTPTSKKGTSLCCEGLESNKLNATIYYGFLSEQDVTTTLPKGFNKSLGQFGVRANFLYKPLSKIPLKLGAIGLDYSFKSTEQVYLGEAIQPYYQDRTEHRVMINHDFATLVSPRFLGYINTQIGVNIRTNNNLLPTSSKNTDYLLDYRLGYHLNYFISKRIVYFIDAGYGGGNIIKTGISLWM